MPSRLNIALKATENSALKVAGILAAQKATFDRNVNLTIDRFLVAPKSDVVNSDS